MKIKCSTLFDITRTNVSKRRGVLENENNYEMQRSQQSNFETLLQIISLRSQPEDISDTVKESFDKAMWGKTYALSKQVSCWTFDFTVHHAAVFNDSIHELGNLLSDCEGVPMIVNLSEMKGLVPQLCNNADLKNIHFEIINEIT
jgi:hypothetical protein